MAIKVTSENEFNHVMAYLQSIGYMTLTQRRNNCINSTTYNSLCQYFLTEDFNNNIYFIVREESKDIYFRDDRNLYSIEADTNMRVYYDIVSGNNLLRRLKINKLEGL